MLKGAVGTRYAEALYEIAAQENLVDKIEQEIKEVNSVIQSNTDLQKALYHPQISSEEKKDLLNALWGRKVSAVTMEFLKLLVEKQREKILDDIVVSYVALANKARNIIEAKITSAVKLTDQEKGQLEKLLNKLTGKRSKISYFVEPSLIGGIVVQIGDRVIDGSIRNRLDTLREHLRQIS